jgi:hypothetical protein
MFWKKKPIPPPLPKGQSSSPPIPKEPVRIGKGHPGTFDAPKNRLEEILIGFRNREVEGSRFFEELFNSSVYILALHQDIVEAQIEPDKIAWSKSPTLFCMNHPEYSSIGLYTSPERGKPTCDLHPEFRFAIKVQAGDFLLSLKGDFGLVINPYWDINLEWNNQQVREILSMMRRDPPPSPSNQSAAFGSSDSKFSESFTGEMRRELEQIGEVSENDVSENDVLTAGLGMIKMGASELMPGWLSQFGKADVYSVGIDSAAPESAFVFGPTDDRTYLPVFTRRSLAEKCIAEMPLLKFVIPIQGVSILNRALKRGLGIWINPLNEACSFRVPSNMVERFLEEASRP